MRKSQGIKKLMKLPRQQPSQACKDGHLNIYLKSHVELRKLKQRHRKHRENCGSTLAKLDISWILSREGAEAGPKLYNIIPDRRSVSTFMQL